jgi:hypothetical protein
MLDRVRLDVLAPRAATRLTWVLAHSEQFEVNLTRIHVSVIVIRLRCGVEQWQLVGLITRRSQVQVLPPLP